MFEEYYEKHMQALLPTSYQSNNFLVDNKYYLSAQKYFQFAVGSELIAEYINYFLKHIGEYAKLYKLSDYYGETLNNDLLIRSLDVDPQFNILFNRIDVVFSGNQLKLLEANINMPTTFSEQIYDQLKNNHYRLEFKLEQYFQYYTKPTTIVFVVENGKADSVSSFFALKRMIKNPYVELILAENKNLIIEDSELFVFNTNIKVDQVIYYVPFEHPLYAEQLEQLITLHNQKTIKILSAPGTIYVQAKGFMALSTRLVEDGLLPAKYQKIVEQYFLKTFMVNDHNVESLVARKDEFIFKPVYGRTSTGTFIGKAFDSQQLQQYFLEIDLSKEMYIAQELVEIEGEQLPKQTFGATTYELCYPVFGCFLINCEYVQVISRLSKRYITNDDAWTLPIVPLDKIRVNASRLQPELKLNTAQKLDFMFANEFNGFNIGENEYITNQALVIEEKIVDELKYVAEQYTELLIKTQSIIIQNPLRFKALYSWNEEYIKSTSKIFSIISRVDLIITDNNKIKVLESNVETPAGLVEGFELSSKLVKPGQADGEMNKIKEVIRKRLLEITDYGQVLALITLDYYEDVYNLKPLKKLIEQVVLEMELDIKVEIITIQNLMVNNGNLYSYDGRQIKVMYRYFPLDWFSTYPYYKHTLKAIEGMFITGELISLTPNETIISQHKSINAIIYQLLKKNVYSQQEKQFIKKYIPFTAVNRDYFFEHFNKQKPFLTKSTLGREGAGIFINAQYEREVIFQEMENTAMVNFTLVNTSGETSRAKGFPVYGVYITDTKACGIYTRVSDQITNKKAYFLPLVVNKKVDV